MIAGRILPEVSPDACAETACGDRELRLAGYEVYRFGGYELAPGRARNTVEEFFNRLLDIAG